MFTPPDAPTGHDAAIIARMVRPDAPPLSEDAAVHSLDPGDQRRLHDLLVRNQSGGLTPSESGELERYLRVSVLIDLVHAKARSALKVPG